MTNPYQAPTTAIEPVSAMEIGKFKDASTLTFLVRLCLAAEIFMSAAGIFNALWQRNVFLQAAAGSMSADNVYTEMGLPSLLLPLLQLPVMIASTVFIAMWIYRSAHNIRSIVGARQMAFTPGWAVGWFFIPFANLWKPYQAMKEIWSRSFSKDPKWEVTTWLLPLWWFLWLIWNSASNISMRLNMRANTLELEAGARISDVVCDAINIVLCLVFLMVVNQLYRQQKARYADALKETSITMPGPNPANDSSSTP
jgi:hypothetical protein